MKIDKIEIKGLFDKKDIVWQLNPQVNVLVGENGSGKSTILDIIHTYFTKTPSDKIINLTFNSSIKFTNTVIHFNFKDKKTVAKETIQRLQSNLGSETFAELKEKDPTFIDLIENNQPAYQFYEHIFDNSNDLLRNINDKFSIIRINSHINDYHANESLNLRTRTEKNNKLDIEIQDMIDELSKIMNDDLVKSLEVSINIFFNQIGKNITKNKENNDLIYTDEKTQKTLNYSHLSSGERQLIYILLRVALSNQDKSKTAIILMDEPEISLHLDWQEHFIEQLTILNPDAQFIIVTHSPALIMNGWNDVYTDMEEITTWL